MAVYTVHEPPRRNDDALAHTERFAFVRDGFSWPAVLFAPLWVIRHRIWLALIVYLLVVSALGAATRVLGAGDWVLAIGLLVVLLVGFEASTLRRYGLARRRWKILGVVVGDDLESAERRFFDTWVVGRVPRPAPTPSASGPAVPAPSGPIIGLFPAPGARACPSPSSITAPAICTRPPRRSSAPRANPAATNRFWSPPIRTRCGAPTAWCCPASAPLPIAGAGLTRFPAWSRRWKKACAARPGRFSASASACS